MAVSCMRNKKYAMSPLSNNYFFIVTVRSLWTWLWGRYHVSQNVFLVLTLIFILCKNVF